MKGYLEHPRILGLGEVMDAPSVINGSVAMHEKLQLFQDRVKEDVYKRQVSYCAICDAFFYRGKDVAVLGNGDFAMHEAKELSNTASTVTDVYKRQMYARRLRTGIIM